MKTLLLACGLVLAPLMSASATSEKSGPGSTSCYNPKSEGLEDMFINCDRLPPEEVVRQRAESDARNADLQRRYDEQKALTVPATKPDLTLLCRGPKDYDTTVQIWFGVNVLAWGMGPNSDVWRLSKVLPNEIAFEHVFQLGQHDFYSSSGHIDRVTGDYAREIPGGGMGNAPMGTNRGDCKPAAPKF
jgi:hypothetical protein